MPSSNSSLRNAWWQQQAKPYPGAVSVVITDSSGRPIYRGSDTDPIPGFNFKNGSATAMNVNGTPTPVDFAITPPAGQIYEINEISLTFADTGSGPTDFGGVAGPLGVGVQLYLTEVISGSPVTSPVFGKPLKSNQDVISLSQSVQIVDYTTTRIVKFRVNLMELLKNTLRLDGSLGMSLAWRISDNLTGLTFMESVAWGGIWYPGDLPS